jgi:hypothetical protein
MKIECTKREWSKLLTLMTATYSDSTKYSDGKAECLIYCWLNAPILNIDVTFVDEFVELKDNE